MFEVGRWGRWQFESLDIETRRRLAFQQLIDTCVDDLVLVAISRLNALVDRDDLLF